MERAEIWASLPRIICVIVNGPEPIRYKVLIQVYEVVVIASQIAGAVLVPILYPIEHQLADIGRGLLSTQIPLFGGQTGCSLYNRMIPENSFLLLKSSS